MPSAPAPDPIDVPALAAGVLGGERAVLARAITLIESTRPDHRGPANDLLERLLARAGGSRRIGITGAPGVGKSTLIDTFGSNLTAAGHRVAVLAVDPTSSLSGGSILGDKTRMARLATDPNAFIRPSPNARTLGGVAARTRETITLCEAAGFDVVIVETVGVGQSEIAVAGMVDFFLALVLAGAGDDLQGLKKGLLEIADLIAVTKADGDNVERARRAVGDYRAALNILQPQSPHWRPPVLMLSGRDNVGLEELWQHIEAHRSALGDSGEFDTRRQRQAVAWMHEMLEERLLREALDKPGVRDELGELEGRVGRGEITPAAAVEDITRLIATEPAPLPRHE